MHFTYHQIFLNDLYNLQKQGGEKLVFFLEGGGCKSFMKSWNAWIIDSHSNAGADVCRYFLVTILIFSVTSGVCVGCFCIWVCWVWHRGNNFTIIVVVTSCSYRYGCLSKSYEQESHPFWECLLVGLDYQKCGSSTACIIVFSVIYPCNEHCFTLNTQC